MIFIEVIKKRFGHFEGETVWQWTMINDHGMKISVLNYGAIITSIETKDKFGEYANISLGFSDMDDYLHILRTLVLRLVRWLVVLRKANFL